MLNHDSKRKKRTPGEQLLSADLLNDFNQAHSMQDVSLKKAIYASNIRGDNNQTFNLSIDPEFLDKILAELEDINHHLWSIREKDPNFGLAKEKGGKNE